MGNRRKAANELKKLRLFMLMSIQNRKPSSSTQEMEKNKGMVESEIEAENSLFSIKKSIAKTRVLRGKNCK